MCTKSDNQDNQQKNISTIRQLSTLLQRILGFVPSLEEIDTDNLDAETHKIYIKECASLYCQFNEWKNSKYDTQQNFQLHMWLIQNLLESMRSYIQEYNNINSQYYYGCYVGCHINEDENENENENDNESDNKNENRDENNYNDVCEYDLSLKNR